MGCSTTRGRSIPDKSHPNILVILLRRQMWHKVTRSKSKEKGINGESLLATWPEVLLHNKISFQYSYVFFHLSFQVDSFCAGLNAVNVVPKASMLNGHTNEHASSSHSKFFMLLAGKRKGREEKEKKRRNEKKVEKQEGKVHSKGYCSMYKSNFALCCEK